LTLGLGEHGHFLADLLLALVTPMRDLFFERAVVQLVVLQQQTQTLEQSDHDVLLLERAAAHWTNLRRIQF